MWVHFYSYIYKAFYLYSESEKHTKSDVTLFLERTRKEKKTLVNIY